LLLDDVEEAAEGLMTIIVDVLDRRRRALILEGVSGSPVTRLGCAPSVLYSRRACSTIEGHAD
jgi:hypothetical protein